MDLLGKLFRKKKSPPEEIAKPLKIQLMLEGALTMPEQSLQLVREVTVLSMAKEHSLDEATARAYYDEIFNVLKQELLNKLKKAR